ncbi:glycoside hydrolase family 18 protein [Planctomycetota bacterium]|nr:glycoside hydrolase family 18 protein [Planctomycetota bacterium]
MSSVGQSKSSFFKRPPLKRIILWLIIPFILTIAYLLWNPSSKYTDGRFDKQTNAIWLQHGWLGDDAWFARNKRDKTKFRDRDKIIDLFSKLKSHNITYLYPHLCPASSLGPIPSVDHQQTARFLNNSISSAQGFDFKVLPWIGGVLEQNCQIDSTKWRASFIASAVQLLETYPTFAGLHLNIEPLPTGNTDFLTLLTELKAAMPSDKILSVAAYPPPTFWHPHPDLHWDEDYYKQIDSRVDQIVPMMYDTSINYRKIYQQVIANWTDQILSWSPNSQVILGVPAYDDTHVDYHNPDIENITNSIRTINKTLAPAQKLPPNYQGIAIYCEWQMTSEKWNEYQTEFQGN